jgi:hypothetical protein
VQGHTKDVDTALVTTSEVTDYPMILLLGIGYVSGCVTRQHCKACLLAFDCVLSALWYYHMPWLYSRAVQPQLAAALALESCMAAAGTQTDVSCG